MKKFLSLAVAVFMLVGTSLNVQAEAYRKDEGWSVTFDGKKMKNSFSASDIDSAIYDILPGDTIEIHVDLKNTSGKKADWYMTNQVLQSLEDSKSVAEGGAYTYVLTYVNPEGESTLLYSSETVGGEKENEAGEGLHEADDSLKDYFYLGRMGAGKSGEIVLKVGLEGETQGNDYQNTLARLQMNFAVEPTIEGSHKTVTKKVIKTVKTGDDTNVQMFVIAAGLSGCICLTFGVLNNKKRNEDDNGLKRRCR